MKSRVLVTHPVVAASVAGVALWMTRASFDVAGSTQAPVRVAMMPSIPELFGLVVMCLLIAAGMASLVRVPGSDQPFWEPIRDALQPLYALGLLALPYLPWLADWIPALRLLAGPGRQLLWVVVVGQVLWIFVPQLLQRRLGIRSSAVSGAHSALVFACVSVFFSAPFLSNARSLPGAFTALLETTRHAASARPSNISIGALGNLFDQEFGIFWFAPVLVLGFLGLGAMMRDPTKRRIGAAVAGAASALIVLSGTIDPWWRRSVEPGRSLVLLFPLLVAPIAWLYVRLPRPSWPRAAAQALLLLSLGISVVVWSFPEDVPLRQEGDGISSLLGWLSPTWHLWSGAPTYVATPPLAASLRAGVWVAGFALLGWLSTRMRWRSEGRTALVTATGMAAVGIAITSLTAASSFNSHARFDAEARTLMPLLETFDPIARPIAIRYDTLTLARAEDLPPLFVLSAVPGQRIGKQPLRIVLNARFRLPAGSYRLDVKRSHLAAEVPDAAIFLQIGRHGGAVRSWPLPTTPAGDAQYSFDVPIDAEFVAFRAAPSVEPTIAGLRITPASVVALRKRFPTPSVLGAAAFEHVTAYFHGGAYPERNGFWVQGRTSTRVTVCKMNPGDEGVALAIHSGARDNVVTVSTPEWSHQLQLVRGVTERIIVPTKPGDTLIPLTIRAVDGFVPAEVGRSRDRRLLGAWIAPIPGPVPPAGAAH